MFPKYKAPQVPNKEALLPYDCKVSGLGCFIVGLNYRIGGNTMTLIEELEKLAKEAVELDIRTRQCWERGMRLVEEISTQELIKVMKQSMNSDSKRSWESPDTIIHAWCVATKNSSMTQIVYEVYGNDR